ncbi:MAG: hypothetical protein JHD07_31795, partial [Bradyrhizobium sp.]|nr:hypothetical protein [Bradyrhizobium sp.]
RLRGLEISKRLLQAGEIRFQRVDLAIGGIQLLLMIEGKLGNRLLQEVDIALQTTGTALHGLLDRADLDAGHVLREHGRDCLRREQQHCETNADISKQHEGSSPDDHGNLRLLCVAA